MLTDEQIDSIIGTYSKLITDQGGEVQAAGKWDKRRLAYEVKGRREGNYILMYFTGEPAVASELDRNFKIADDVLRHIIVRVEPQHIDTSLIERAQPAAEAAAEAVTEAEAPAEAAAEQAAEQPTEAPAEAAAEQTEAPAEEPAAETATTESEPSKADTENE